MKSAGIVAGVILTLLGTNCVFGQIGGQAGRSSIPYVATRIDAVRDMLWMAEVGKDDFVYDLGSGDGRIVIAAVRDFRAHRAVGIESDPQRIRGSREKAAKLNDQVKFIHGDLFTADFREASVLGSRTEYPPSPQDFQDSQARRARRFAPIRDG
jgi:SAM-dependent methyltransferase